MHTTGVFGAQPCSTTPPDKEASLLHVPKQQVGFDDVEGGDEHGSVVKCSCLHQGHIAINVCPANSTNQFSLAHQVGFAGNADQCCHSETQGRYYHTSNWVEP